MDKFQRGSIWMVKSRNEINNDSLPFGSKTIVIISNNKLNEKGLISYLELAHKRYETETRIKLQIVNKLTNSISYIFVNTDKVFSVESKYLCCYQGDLGYLELIRLTNKLAENFGINNNNKENNSLKETSVANRILNSKEYSKNIDKIKKMNKTVSNLTQEQKQFIFDNYSKSTRDSIAERFGIYPYERVTNMANYLRTKFKKKGYL